MKFKEKIKLFKTIYEKESSLRAVSRRLDCSSKNWNNLYMVSLNKEPSKKLLKFFNQILKEMNSKESFTEIKYGSAVI